ncbi:kinase inhibitor [Serratia aquatilis]|uniref:Kinase inhibitor n=1 Tax=Serratia aquatilis TaxID=1737515 RepID=A0ABV6EA70_9GAMM
MKRTVLGLSMMAVAMSVTAEEFTLRSNEIWPGQSLADAQVFQGFGCSGKNISPSLVWKNAPAGTKSFAITVYDPDAPTGSGWWHWTMVNIPLSVTQLAVDAGNAHSKNLPEGAVQGRNDFGYAGFGGACPPAGTSAHRYRFTVWALKAAHLPIDNASSGALVGYMLKANVLGTSQLEAIYGR